MVLIRTVHLSPGEGDAHARYAAHRGGVSEQTGRGPGPTASRLVRRLGLDGNPLRRRTDKIAVWLAVLVVAVFLIGAPMAAGAAIGLVSRVAAAEQQMTRSWRQVPAVVQKAAPAPAAWQTSWVPARWTAPGGRPRTGQIPVRVAVAAGQAIRLWVDEAGTPTGPPARRGLVELDDVAAAAIAVFGLGIVLLSLVCAGRLVLDRRRLARWEAAWADVGPRWTKRFRSRG